MIRVLVLYLLSSAALATSPTKEPPKQTPEPTATIDSSAFADATATQGQIQNTTLEQAIDIDERSIGIGLGAGSAHYTGDCVVPKKGRNGRTGFLERGFTVPLLRLDPAVEVDEVCVAHQREMEQLALENEAARLEILRLQYQAELERAAAERFRAEQCFECAMSK